MIRRTRSGSGHGLGLLALVLTLPALTACQDPATLSPDFGNAVRHNMAVHIINPNPAYAPGALPVANGDRTNLAVTRYKTGTTTPLDAAPTSEVGMQASGN